MPIRRQLPFTVVAKPTGAACNLDCKYCFFLSKEQLYEHKRQMMTEKTLENYIRNFLDSAPDTEVILPWQGGEPTLRGLGFFQLALKLAEKYRRPQQKVVHAIQTNGTLLTEEWGKFLADNDILVGISMDGPAEYHDAYRVNKAQRGTHAQVLRGWEILQRYGVKTNIICTVHNANQEFPLEIYRYFRDVLGAKFLQFIPIVERVDVALLAQAEQGWGAGSKEGLLYRQSGEAVTSRSVSPQKWGEFLVGIFDEWVQNDVGEVYVQHFDVALSAIFNIHTLCVHAPECPAALAIEFNGDVYSCDHYVEPGFILGNINGDSSFIDLITSPQQREFSQAKANMPRVCEECSVRKFCFGGCPKDRFIKGEAAKEIANAVVDPKEPPLNYLCAGYKRFYTHIRPDLIAMARLLRSGRGVFEIMDPEIRAYYRPRAAKN